MVIYDLKTRVYGRMCASNPRRVWGVGDFEDFGASSAVAKVLQRLVEAGNIRRIDRGLYDRPRLNKLTGKTTAADYRAVIDAIARRDQTRMLVDGMTAANDLGLSDAVPGRVIIHSDARLKPIHLENLIINFKPTSASKLYWAGRPAMRVVQALHWLKPKLGNPEDRERIKRRINTLFSDPKHGAVLRRDILAGFTALPVWMKEFLNDMKSLNNNPTRKSKILRRANKPGKMATT